MHYLPHVRKVRVDIARGFGRRTVVREPLAGDDRKRFDHKGIG